MNTESAFILGLDCSSSRIGYCFLQGRVVAHGVILLPDADISERCLVVRCEVEALIARYPIDAVAIESPVARFAKSVIPQARVSGVVLMTIAQHALVWCEIDPKTAKLVLAEDGAATKREMLMAAAPHFGYCAETLVYRCKNDRWAAWLDGCAAPEYGEDEADALGVALAAATKVTVEVAA